MGNGTSASLTRDRGLIQGSCQGHVLFNIYTYDLSGCVKSCTVHQYADDCQMQMMSYSPKMADEAISLINSDLTAYQVGQPGMGSN